jgi:hypothetical protein
MEFKGFFPESGSFARVPNFILLPHGARRVACGGDLV